MVEESPVELYLWEEAYPITYSLSEDSPTDGGWGTNDNWEGGQDQGDYDDDDYNYDDDDYNWDDYYGDDWDYLCSIDESQNYAGPN